MRRLPPHSTLFPYTTLFRSPSNMTLPLSGLLVVSVEQAVAAPQCTCRLADAGARVIKVERPEGDFARDYDHVVHGERDRKSTRLNSSHLGISYAVFCLKKKK